MTTEVNNDDRVIYAIAIAQFLLGVLITIVNTLMVAVLITSTKLRKNVTHCLLTNMWFANLFLGVIIAVVNVVETTGINATGYRMVSIEKPKGTITIINSLVTIATLLTLIINRFLVVRFSKNGMTLKNVAVIILMIWLLVFVLTFVKAIVSSLNKYNGSACFICFLNFEVVVLILLGIVSVFFFIVTIFKALLKKKHNVADSAQSQPTVVPAVQEPGPKQPLVRTLDMNSNDSMHTTVTIGIMLIVFLLVMASYILMQAVWIYQHIEPDASEIVICIFYIHCLINPAIVMCRDKDLTQHMKKLITCKSDNEEIVVGQQQQQVIYQPMMIPAGMAPNPYNQNPQMVDMSMTPLPQNVQIENQYHPNNIRRTDTVNSLQKSVIPPIGEHHEVNRSAAQQKPTAPQISTDEPMTISHIDDRLLHDNARFNEPNVGFVENGELIRHM